MRAAPLASLTVLLLWSDMVTSNTAFVVPEFPSVTDTLLMVRVIAAGLTTANTTEVGR